MPISKFEKQILQNAEGVILTNFTITVRRAVVGKPLANIYSDVEGVTAKDNPFNVGSDGNIVFYAEGGTYEVKITAPGFSKTLENEQLGTASSYDKEDLGIGANVDVQVDNLAARAAYDAEIAGFSVLVADVGDGRAARYERVGAAGNWTAPAYITGPAGTTTEIVLDEIGVHKISHDDAPPTVPGSEGDLHFEYL